MPRTTTGDEALIDSEAALRALYPPVTGRARRGRSAALDAHCRRFVAPSPFTAPRPAPPLVIGARAARSALPTMGRMIGARCAIEGPAGTDAQLGARTLSRTSDRLASGRR